MKTLMEEILKSRGSSPKEERRLCLMLYSEAQKNEKLYEKAFALTYLADAYQSMGLPFKSMRICQMALKAAEENEYESLLLVLYNLLGILYVDLDDEQGAMDCFLKGMSLSKKTQNKSMLATQSANIAYIYQRVGEYEKAMLALDESHRFFVNASSTEEVLIGEGFYHLQKAGILTKQGKTKEALELLSQIEVDKEDYYGIDAWMVYADCYSRMQRKEQAIDCLKKVQKELMQDGNDLYRLDCFCDMIEVFLQIHEYEQAKNAIHKANELLEKMNLAGRRVKVASYEIELFQAINDKESLKEAYKRYFECDLAFEKERKTAAQKRVRRRIELQEEYDRHAGMEVRQSALETKNEVDELTEILNRRGLRRHLHALFDTASKNNQRFCVIMIDVDFFKEFNDEYGHVAGDHCLKKLAQLLKRAAGENGISGRYGGDEFMLAFADHKTNEIAKILREVQSELFALSMPNRRSAVSSYVTITMGGINVVPSPEDDVHDYVNAADQALYRIKKNTRNGFEITESLESLEAIDTSDE